jgi:hypothetical protein
MTPLEVIEDYEFNGTKHSSGDQIKLDVFIPDLLLAFEYQGEQHFIDKYQLGPQWIYQRRAAEKRSACSTAGIRLVEVPYWWDCKNASLQEFIYTKYPDIVSRSSDVKMVSTEAGNISSSTKNLFS